MTTPNGPGAPDDGRRPARPSSPYSQPGYGRQQSAGGQPNATSSPYGQLGYGAPQPQPQPQPQPGPAAYAPRADARFDPRPQPGPGAGGFAPGFGRMENSAPARHPVSAPGAVAAPAPPAMFLPSISKPSSLVMNLVTILVLVIAFVIMLLVFLFSMLSSSAVHVLGSIAAAFIPLTTIWFVVQFLDRWEPEPPILLFGAVAWGGGFAVAGALLTGTLRQVVAPALGDDYGAFLEAPVSEEFWKGLGLIVIYAIARRHFNGPTDGVVYGVLLGAGFAFTENVLYFSSQWAEMGISGLIGQYVVRGIALPLLHPMAVSLTGIAVGIGARRGGWGSVIAAFFIGLVPAMLLHSLWNTGSTVVQRAAADPMTGLLNLVLFFFFVMVPIFAGWIVLVVMLRRGDRRLVRERLTEYGMAGWFSPQEVDMLSTMRGRTSLRAWAKSYGAEGKRAMKAFIESSTVLAHARHQLLVDPGNERKRRDEHDSLTRVAEVRRVMAALQGRAPTPMAAGPSAPARGAVAGQYAQSDAAPRPDLYAQPDGRMPGGGAPGVGGGYGIPPRRPGA